MLTAGDDGAGYWLTVSELARQRGVSKQALTKRVDRLERHGLLNSKAGERGTRLVNVAEFDRAAGEATDAVRAFNGSGATDGAAHPVLAKEQARRAGYDADLKQLELEERLGNLMPVKDVEDAMARCAEAIVRTIEQMPARAEEGAAMVARDGVAGERAFLRGLARNLREQLARAMNLAAGEKDAEEAA